jgi:hypothetical protein
MFPELFTRNPGQKIFSLVLASLIWFAVHAGLTLGSHGPEIGNDTRLFEGRPITVLTPAADLGRYEVRPEKVSFLLRGDAVTLAKIRPQDLEVYVNLIETSSARMTRPIHIYAPAGTEVVAVNPAEVLVERLPNAVLPSGR